MPGKTILLARPALWFSSLAVALILLGVVAALIWLGPLPSRVVVMTTGTPGSDYEMLGLHYQAVLKRFGVDLRLMPSAGAVENLRRLNNPRSGVSIGFAQGGLTSDAHSPGLESLGTIFFQPFWFFSRLPLESGIAELRGKKIAIGLEGSGTHELAMQLFALNGIDPGSFARLLTMSPEQASDALLSGELDAVAMVTAWESKPMRRLLASPDANLLNFVRADSYVALHPYLSKLILPAGVGNMAMNRPPTAVNLIAPKASLIVRRELHPAIQYLLLEAATENHSAATIFQQPGQFPAAERGDLPLSPDARQFYKTGPPFLQRYLPFWLAVSASRLLVLLVPLLGIVYPLFNAAPELYREMMQNKIFRLYGELKFIEAEMERGADRGEVRARLKLLRERAGQVRVPVNLTHFLYQLSTHIELVDGRLGRGDGGVEPK
jgi:TRAP-type uncharacterized transport system substrate-binding protein